MAIAVGSTSNTPTYGNRTNSTITAPSGITNGDLLVAVLHVGDATALPALVVTPPAGWTEVTNSPSARDEIDPYTIAMHVFYKVASGESGNYTFTHTSADTEGFMYRLTGCDTTTPIDANPAANNGDGTTTTLSAVTTVTDGCFLVAADSSWDAPGAGNYSGTTPTFAARRTGTLSKIFDATQTTAGSTGARTRTNGNTGGTVAWASILVPIRPASGGSPQEITGAIYTDTDTFNAATVSSAYTISGAVYTDTDTFPAATATTTYGITGGLFSDGDTFHVATLSGGATQNITGGLYTDTDTIHASTVNSTYAITGAIYTDTDTFNAATASYTYAITGALYSDADTFNAAAVSGGQQGDAAGYSRIGLGIRLGL